MKRKRNLLAAVLCVLTAVFVLTGCQLVRGIDVGSGDQAEVAEAMGKASLIEVQDAEGNYLGGITSQETLAGFIEAMTLEAWQPAEALQDAEVKRQLVFKEEATIHFGETESSGLKEVVRMKTYVGSDVVSLALWKITLWFQVPQSAIEYIDNLF
ncbi:MAG: hypothetical protein Q4C55_01535 [Eubacterium sp.]|nr:hypothetical protein [Eubacterium sp.]